MDNDQIIEAFRLLRLETDEQRRRFQKMVVPIMGDVPTQVRVIVADNTRAEVCDAELERGS